MPKGWRTLDGARPEYAEQFGVVEHVSSAYKPRTYVNVKESDFTLRVATNFNSPGEVCTLAAIRKHDKPHANIWVRKGVVEHIETRDVGEAIENIRACCAKLGRPLVLNVAGNSERTARGIGDSAFKLVHHILQELGHG